MASMALNRKLSFDDWMKLVDFHIARMLSGLTSDDLPDYLYRDAYDDGHIPHTVARRAIRAAKNEFGY